VSADNIIKTFYDLNIDKNIFTETNNNKQSVSKVQFPKKVFLQAMEANIKKIVFGILG
jgi:hypothetical protein